MGLLHIYGLHGPDGVVRYVGSTVNVAHRLAQHRHSARSGHSKEWDFPRSRWMREVGVESVSLRVLEVVKFDIGKAIEKEWISNLLSSRSLFNVMHASAEAKEEWSHKWSKSRWTPDRIAKQAEIGRANLRSEQSVAKVAAIVRSPERRKMASDRMRGEGHNMAILTEAQAIEIIANGRKPGEKNSDIADRYGVTASCIGAVLRGQTWKHLDRG